MSIVVPVMTLQMKHPAMMMMTACGMVEAVLRKTVKYNILP